MTVICSTLFAVLFSRRSQAIVANDPIHVDRRKIVQTLIWYYYNDVHGYQLRVSRVL